MPEKIKVICEVASAHNGSIDYLNHLIVGCVNAGATFIKFQVYKPDELIDTNSSKFERFRTLALSKKEWECVLSFARSWGVNVIIEPYGRTALAWTEKWIENDLVVGFKIANSEIGFCQEYVGLARQNIDCYIAVGLGLNEANFDLSEIQTFIESARSSTALVGIQRYPTQINNQGLNVLSKMRNSLPVSMKLGFSDHTDSQDRFWRYGLSLLALCHGVEVIEKHVCLDSQWLGRDHSSSLNPLELKQFLRLVDDYESVQKGIGSNSQEEKYFDELAHVVRATADIESGSVVDLQKVTCGRSDDEDDLRKSLRIKDLGKKANRKIPKGSIVDFSWVND